MLLLVSGAATGCSHGHPAATAAFGDLIKQRYGAEEGVWRCAHGYDKGRLDCYAEVHRGSRYRTVYARTPAPPVAPRFSKITAQAWDRTWRVLPPNGSGPLRLVRLNASVRAFDWGWLMSAAISDYHDNALPRLESSIDGGSKGMPRAIFWFRCAPHGRVVTCRNRLGDELRLAFTAGGASGRG